MFHVCEEEKEASGIIRKNMSWNISDEVENIVFEIKEKLKTWRKNIRNIFGDDLLS